VTTLLVRSSQMPAVKRVGSCHVHANGYIIRDAHMNKQALGNNTYRAEFQQYPPELSRPKLHRHQIIGEPKSTASNSIKQQACAGPIKKQAQREVRTSNMSSARSLTRSRNLSANHRPKEVPICSERRSTRSGRRRYTAAMPGRS
jgi:hypothetical protein